MAYKIIDGKLCKVEEVDSSQLKIEVEQCLNVVEEQRKKVSNLEAQKKNVVSQYDNQIENLNAQIRVLEERKVKACEPYDVEIRLANSKIDEVKLRLNEKKEAIQCLLPEAYNKLGF